MMVKGYLQREGIDYQDTSAPSTQHKTIRLILSRMASEAWESCQMDMMTEFLNSFYKKRYTLSNQKGLFISNIQTGSGGLELRSMA